jgi:hypothetical protein
MLELIADLYTLANTPEPAQDEVAARNGWKEVILHDDHAPADAG